MHVDQGLPDPLVGCLQLQRVLGGIKRTQDLSSSTCLPITDRHMLIIHRSLGFDVQDHVMLWAASTLAYFGILRASEFTVPSLSNFNLLLHLTVADIAVDSQAEPTCLRLSIKTSKTDPFSKGCHIYIGRGNPPLCALSALLPYLELRGSSPGPLFICSNGHPLSRAFISQWLKDTFAAAGIDGPISTHSFRIGAATVAACAGIPDHLIQAMGRWTSNAYQLYIRTPAEALAQMTPLLSH